MNRCPSRDELGRLLAEDLDGPEASAVETHVQSCSKCQACLAELAGTPLCPSSVPSPPEARPRASEPAPEFLRRLHRTDDARLVYQEARLLTDNPVERDFLTRRISELGGRS